MRSRSSLFFVICLVKLVLKNAFIELVKYNNVKRIFKFVRMTIKPAWTSYILNFMSFKLHIFQVSYDSNFICCKLHVFWTACLLSFIWFKLHMFWTSYISNFICFEPHTYWTSLPNSMYTWGGHAKKTLKTLDPSLWVLFVFGENEEKHFLVFWYPKIFFPSSFAS